RYPQVASDNRHNRKYVGRRPIDPPTSGPTRHPTIAPSAETRPVIALASGIFPSVSLSAQTGAHCTDPQVPIRAIEAKAIASRVVLRRPGEKISRIGRATIPVTDSFQRSDSGTNRRMKKVKSAGAAPTTITHRHESTVTLNESVINPISAK